jgi:hypothetical protein
MFKNYFSHVSVMVLGYLAIAGGVLGLALAPVMVIIKYMTGWNVIPQPGWVGVAHDALGPFLQFGQPPVLWMTYGTIYTIALLLMLTALIGMSDHLRDARGRVQSNGYWIVVAGLCLVIPGDAIHTWTWHQNGLMTPTPGTNPVANTAYAVHMMGMNFVMAGATTIGVSALRRKFLAPWLAWSCLAMFPAAVAASITLLPTTPSGALWWFSVLMMVCGWYTVTGKAQRLVPCEA